MQLIAKKKTFKCVCVLTYTLIVLIVLRNTEHVHCIRTYTNILYVHYTYTVTVYSVSLLIKNNNPVTVKCMFLIQEGNFTVLINVYLKIPQNF